MTTRGYIPSHGIFSGSTPETTYKSPLKFLTSTASTVLNKSDMGSYIFYTPGHKIKLPLASTIDDGWYVNVLNTNSSGTSNVNFVQGNLDLNTNPAGHNVTTGPLIDFKVVKTGENFRFFH